MKKLNIGCGAIILDGYTNVDLFHDDPRVVNADLAEPWPFESGTVDEILADDILEHFPPDTLRDDVLPQAYRVLKSGGLLVCRLPDLYRIVEQWQSGKHTDHFTALRIHGRQDRPGNLHYFTYTFQTFSDVLVRNGFVDIVRNGSVETNMNVTARRPG